MPKWDVKYNRGKGVDETIEADHYFTRGPWIIFERGDRLDPLQAPVEILRIKTADVRRMELVDDAE